MNIRFIPCILGVTLLTACTMQNNPLLSESPLPYGAPQFDKIKPGHYLPAFEEAFRQGKQEIDAIVANPDAPTFQNTIEALEYAGSAANRVEMIFYNILEADATDQLQEIAEKVSPMETEYSMYISLNDKLFERIKTVYNQRNSLDLEPDQMKLLEDTYKSFERSGANLSPEDKKKYSEINEKLSLLTLQFQKNQLSSTNNFQMVLTDEADLAGLPGYIRDMAAQAAKDKGVEGWLFDLSAPSYGGFMKFSDRRDLREKMYRAYNRRAYGDEWDNTETIRQIVDLRYQEAALLGYKDYADYKTELRMVGNGAAVWDFIEKLRAPALPKAKEEVAELNKYAKSIGFDGDQIRPWDFSYYAEKQRVAKYNLTDEELKPYFRLEDCIDAIFSLANRLYGITFQPANVPVYHPDVKVYEVRDADGSFLALFYADFFPRATKRSGAWMTEFRGLKIENGVEERPFISLVTNFTKPTADTPSLITHDEFTTMLHEFGHSLHGMLAKGRYPSMTCTNVDHDFVELPSQIMENWGYEKEYLQSFAKHYQTGDALPDSLIAKIKASKNYLSAYYHMRQLQFGILDMNYHTQTKPIQGDIIKFEKNALISTDVLPTVPECIISTSFSHIFSGGYAAGYYSYKWAEVLAADGFSLFEEKGIFDKQTAAKFRHLLEQGGSVEAAKLYREFRGHDPEPAALLRQLEIIENDN
ncbi:MAG: M3 family metallopeptidase [Bacteroidaceae bacterium]|nr:M3 family metallopeptidase [Bacteroidaceae bacterium]